ncbi:hypothetical protein LINPERHAP1_LOCUS10111, partial [Linum perenne]
CFFFLFPSAGAPILFGRRLLPPTVPQFHRRHLFIALLTPSSALHPNSDLDICYKEWGSGCIVLWGRVKWCGRGFATKNGVAGDLLQRMGQGLYKMMQMRMRRLKTLLSRMMKMTWWLDAHMRMTTSDEC